jgi:hypothetical protein
MYDIQHCFIPRPSDSTVSEAAGIEPRTVATTALAVRRSNHSARSQPNKNTACQCKNWIESANTIPHSEILFIANCRVIFCLWLGGAHGAGRGGEEQQFALQLRVGGLGQ